MFLFTVLIFIPAVKDIFFGLSLGTILGENIDILSHHILFPQPSDLYNHISFHSGFYIYLTSFQPFSILSTFLWVTFYIMSSAHSSIFLSLHLYHSLFSNPSVTLPMSQLILLSFCCFTYVTAHSITLLLLLLHHRIFTYVT